MFRVSRRSFVKSTAAAAAVGAASSSFVAPAVIRAQNAPVEIVFHHIWGTPPGTTSEHRDPIMDVIDLFNSKEAETGVRVISRTDSGSYAEVLQKTQAEMATGNGPDIVSTPWANINWAREGLNMRPLNDVSDQLEELQKGLRPEVLPLVTIDDQMWGLPYAFSTPIMYLNRDIFDEAGINPDDVLNDWAFLKGDAAMALKDHVGGPLLDLTDGQWPAQGIAQSNGGFVMDKNNHFVMDSPETIEAMATIAELDELGILNRSTRQEANAAFIGGSLPVFYASVASLKGLREQAAFNMETHTFPVFTGKDRYMSCGGSFLGMYAQDAEKQQAVMEYLKFSITQEAYEIWNQRGYMNATTLDMPVVPGQEPSYTHLEEGITPETPWPTARGGEYAAMWAEMVARIWTNDISAEEGCTQIAAELNDLVGQ